MKIYDLCLPCIIIHPDGNGTFGITVYYDSGKNDYITNGMTKDDAREYAEALADELTPMGN